MKGRKAALRIAIEEERTKRRDEHHLMGVPGDRVRVFHTAKETAVFFRNQKRRSMRAVRVKPDVAFAGKGADFIQRIKRPRCRRTGGTADKENFQPVFFCLFIDLGKTPDVHSALFIHRHF